MKLTQDQEEEETTEKKVNKANWVLEMKMNMKIIILTMQVDNQIETKNQGLIIEMMKKILKIMITLEVKYLINS